MSNAEKPELDRQPPAQGFGMALFGTVVIAGTVVIRMSNAAITFSWFDVDPMTVDAAAVGLLPGFRLWLDAIMLLGAALILAAHARQRIPACGWVLLLAVIPIPLLLWHGWGDPVDLEQGSLWIASVISAVALAHAALDARLRAIGTCIVLGGLALVLVRAVSQVAWDIPATIAWFEANREETLAMRGLEPGSSAALVFERRLRGAAPTAWFTTANLLASVMAAGASAWLAITIASVRAKLTSGVSGLCALLAVAMAAMVIASGSRGGIVVLVIGVCFVVASVCWSRWSRVGGLVAVSLVLLALLAAPLSGLLGDLPGTRSLLIRNGYVTGAADIVMESPLAGVGPGGFREAWLTARSPESPEEIDSPHAMPWDWAAAIGVASLAWMALVLAALWWSSRSCRPTLLSTEAWPLCRITFSAAALIVGFGLARTQMLEVITMGSAVAFFRILGWLLFIALAGFLGWLWKRAETGITWGLCAAAVVLVIHAQVEMTIEQATTAPWLLAVLGLAAPIRSQGEETASRSPGVMIAGLGAGVAAALAILVVIIGAWPATSAQRAERVHGMLINSGRSLDNTSGLVTLSGRESAADGLLEAAAIRDDDRLRFVAAEQLLAGLSLAMQATTPPSETQAEAARQRAFNIAMDVFDRTGSVPAGQLAVTVMMGSGDAADLAKAVVVAERVAAADPAGLWSNRHLADALWESGERDVAAGVYQRVLELNAARTIDPLRQLSDADRTLIEERARWSP